MLVYTCRTACADLKACAFNLSTINHVCHVVVKAEDAGDDKQVSSQPPVINPEASGASVNASSRTANATQSDEIPLPDPGTYANGKYVYDNLRVVIPSTHLHFLKPTQISCQL